MGCNLLAVTDIDSIDASNFVQLHSKTNENQEMKNNTNLTLLLAVCGLFGIATSAGCENTDSTTANKTADHGHDHEEDGSHSHDDDGHDHAAHAEEFGPKGGHVIAFDDSKGFAEWTHNDNEDKVTVYLLDETKKSLQPAAVTKAYFTSKSGDKSKEFELTATDAVDGKAATFERTDKALLVALNLGVDLTLETADGSMKIFIKPHVH